MQLVLKRKKRRKNPNVTEENRQWCIRNAKRKPYTQEIWTPGSFCTNKGAFLLIFYMFIFFKYTILKCLYRASYALIRGAFHLCLKGRGGGKKKTNAGGGDLRALSVSYNAGFFFTQPSDPWRREGWGTPLSAAPY